MSHYLTFTTAGHKVEAPVVLDGLSVDGFTSVTVHDGNDSSDPVVAKVGAGNHTFPSVVCKTGIYVAVSGTGSATLWLS